MSNRAAHLREMGIDVWVERGNAALDPTQFDPQQLAEVELLDWDELSARVAGCERCELHSHRTQTVFGVGDRNAQVLIIGEAPGAEEDRQGEPFVGRAGQLLNSMLLALGIERKQVFIANILKCRPPNNRDPKPEEASACRGYLSRQISLIQPKVILAVGRISAQNLLGIDTPIGKMRGKVYQLECAGNSPSVPVVVTYHPAYLLRSPQEKRKTWDDLKLLTGVLGAIE